MTGKKSSAALVEQCLNGNLKYVTKQIMGGTYELDDSSYIRIILGICNVCHTNLNNVEALNQNDLIELLCCIIKRIKSTDDYGFQSYSQSLYHIIKFLITKKCYQIITNFDQLIFPHFMPKCLKESACESYINTGKCLYNAVLRLSKEGKPNSNIKSLSSLILEIFSRIDNKKHLLEIGKQLLLILNNNKEVSPQELLKLYRKTLVDELDYYNLMLDNFTIVFNTLLRNEACELDDLVFKLDTRKSNDLKILDKSLKLGILLKPRYFDLVTCKVIEDTYESIKNYLTTFGVNKNVLAVCDFYVSVSYTILSYFRKNTHWIDKIEIHENFYQFLNHIAIILYKTKLNSSARCLGTICCLGKFAITSNKTTKESYKIVHLNYLEKYFNHIKDLRQNNGQWVDRWHDFGVQIYTVGIHLAQTKDCEIAHKYLKNFIQAYIEIETSNSKIIELVYLKTALITVADLYLESKDFEKCLAISAVAISLLDCPKNVFNPWIRAKALSRENSLNKLQELTIVESFTTYATFLLDYLPKFDFSLSKELQIQLLIYEIRQYYLKWKSKVPMSAVLRHLNQIASPQQLAEVFVEIYGDATLPFHETVPKLLSQVIKKLEKENCPQLPHLYFLKHKYRVKEEIGKHCVKLEKEVDTSDMMVPPDPNDECDLSPSSEYLEMSKYLQIMKPLHKSLELIETNPNVSKSFKLLSNIGQEFALHCHKSKAIKSWKLALQLATTNLEKLQATGFILELTEFHSSTLIKLMKDVEASVGSIKESNPVDVIIYYLCKSVAFFHNDFETAYSAFLQAFELHQNTAVPKAVTAKLYLIHHKFISLPCDYNIIEHREFTLVKIHLANNTIINYCNEVEVINSFDLGVFFGIYESLAEMYHNLKLPREVRCYAKDGVEVAMKWALPLRLAQLLFYLAFADLRTCRFDDCRMKIQDLSNILGLSKIKIDCKTPEKLENAISNLAEDFTEMVLDLPTVPQLQKPGSPIFRDDRFKIPSFLNHGGACSCFYCNCVEYQQFVQKKYLLNTLFYDHQNNSSLAMNFYRGTVKICDILSRKSAVNSQQFLEAYSWTLLEYSNFLLRQKLYTETEKCLNKLENFHSNNYYILDELHLLNINLKYLKKELETKPNKPVVCLSIDTEVSNDKTPPNKLSKIVVTPRTVTNLLTPVRIPTKLPKFDLSDVDDKQLFKEPEKVSPPIVAKIDLTKRTKLLTDKLRSSAKKNHGDKENRGSRVKQNLTSQMNATESQERRSNRVRK